MPAPGSPLRIESPAITLAYGEHVRRALRRLGPLFFVLAAAIAAFTEAFIDYRAVRFVVFATMALAVLGGLFYLFSGALRGRTLPGSIELAEGRITLRRGASVQHLVLTDLEQGWIAPLHGVGLRAVDGTELRVECSRTEAVAILDHAGLGPGQRVVRIPLVSAASARRGAQVLATIALMVCGLFFIARTFEALVILVLAATLWLTDHPEGPPESWMFVRIGVELLTGMISGALSAVLLRYLRSRELVIGTDGLAFGGRFVRHRDIVSVRTFGHGVRLGLRDGSILLLPVRGQIRPPLPLDPPDPGSADAAGHELREALLTRIVDARSVPAAAPESQALQALERGALLLSAWRERLRSLLSREGTYRAATVDGSTLRRVVVDPHVPAEQRIAAALALSASEAPEDRREARIAAESCADAELRAALEAAAEGKLDERWLKRATRRVGAPRHRDGSDAPPRPTR